MFANIKKEGGIMSLKQEILDNISKTFERELGITYEEFDKLDFDSQQKLISEYHKKQKRKKSDEVTVMIGSGEHSIFTKVKRGEMIMVGSGEHSCFVRAGISPDEERQELDDKLDDAIYSKPVAFIKKLERKIKNR